jgi:hypothetical protein
MSEHHGPPTGLKLWCIKFLYRRTYPCTEVARLLSQSQDRPLSLGTRVKLRLHSLICVYCQRYARQLTFIHRHGPGLHEQMPPEKPLPAALRDRIKVSLQQARK